VITVGTPVRTLPGDLYHGYVGDRVGVVERAHESSRPARPAWLVFFHEDLPNGDRDDGLWDFWEDQLVPAYDPEDPT
jgi:hypothetical protein